MPYTRVGPWANGSAPYISAANLDLIEDGIVSAHEMSGVNVLDYGAVGDGTADDTTEIQAAIDDAGVDSVVLFPPTTSFYKVSATITPLDGQRWVGGMSPEYNWDPMSTLTTRGQIRAASSFTGNSLIARDGARGVTLSNLSLCGNGEAGTLNGIDFAAVGGSERGWKVLNCHMSSFGGAAMTGYMWVVTVFGTHITRSGYGIRPSHLYTDGKMNDCMLIGNYIYFNIHGGVYLDSTAATGESGASKFIGNRVERSGTYIATDGASTTMDPNVNRDEDAAGFYVRKGHMLTFVGNSTDANAGSGLHLDGATADAVNNVTSVGNLWNRDGTGDNSTTTLAGVTVNNCQRVAFVGDRVSYGDPDDGGLGRYAPQQGVSISNSNKVLWDGSVQLQTGTSTNGIYLGTGNSQIQIRDPGLTRNDIGSGSTRPTAGLVAGATFFDTSLGQPIWYTGSGWVDATGTTA